MSLFSVDWLSLREPLDAASRSAPLSAALAQTLRRNHPRNQTAIQVVDLGAGTAANLRYLAPLIGGSQEWLLVERDRLLLAAVNERLVAWARLCEAHVSQDGEETTVHATGFNCRVRRFPSDLVHDLDRLVLPHGGLVSASALLDLVSKDWLERLAERCVSVDAPVCFALNYDGRIECNPAEKEDAKVRELVNRHQGTDKGFGPALGPRATRQATQIFENLGYETYVAPSDWHVGRDHQSLQRALVDGWFEAALEMDPIRQSELQGWRERRHELINNGQSELIVGHVDITGWPASSDSF